MPLQYDHHSDQCLLKLWKLTRNDYITTKLGSTKRLNNRLWRLLNKRFILNQQVKGVSHKDLCVLVHDRQKNATRTSVRAVNSSSDSSNNSSIHHSSTSRTGTISSLTDLSRDSLSELKPKQSQFLQERPSLFSHSSNLSLSSNRKSSLYNSSDSGKDGKRGMRDSEEEDDYDVDEDLESDDISDISEVEEEDLEEEVEVKSTVVEAPRMENPESQTDFSQENTDSPTHIPQSRTSFVRGFSPKEIPTSLNKKSERVSENDNEKNDKNAQPAGKNIFYIQNSPSPSGKTYSYNKTSNSETNKSTEESAKTSASSSSKPPPFRRQESLFSNFQLNFNGDANTQRADKAQNKSITGIKSAGHSEACSSTDISDDAYSEEDEDEEEEVEKESRRISITVTAPTRARDTSVSTTSLKVHRMPIAQSTTTAGTNDSEWISVSSSSEEVQDRRNSLLEFNKIQLSKSSASLVSSAQSTTTNSLNENTDNYEGPGKRNSTPTITKPRSLLSGLFKAGQSSNTSSKPILKRSSTTGVMTFEHFASVNGNLSNNASNQHAQSFNFRNKRPYMMLTKKFGSSTEVPKHGNFKENADTGNNVSPEIEISKEGCDCESDEGSTLVGKQKSVVGLSDFNAIANTITSPYGDNINSNDKDSNTGHKNPSLSSPHGHHTFEALSTSLTKFSVPASYNSRKSLLSRSSLSLTKFYNNSKFMFMKQDGLQNDNKARSDRSQHNRSKSPEEAMESSEQSKSLNSEFTSSVKSPSAPQDSKSEHEHGICSCTVDDGPSSPSDKTESSKLDLQKLTLSSDLSDSLKQSILLDYTLGKVPLPTKVISSEKLAEAALKEGLIIGGEFEGDDFDDYHSKGW